MYDGRTFTTAQLAKILNRPTRFCIDWTERGLFEADIQAAAGAGTRREFSYAAVLRAGLALYLQEKYKYSRAKIKETLELLAEWDFFTYWGSNLEAKKELFRRGGTDLSPPYQDLNELTLIIINSSDQTEVVWEAASMAHALMFHFQGSEDIVYDDVTALNLNPLKASIDAEIAKL
jgi:hypothetical protein